MANRVVKNLSEIFDHHQEVNEKEQKKKLRFPNDFLETPVPICQHNLYHLFPFHAFLKESETLEQFEEAHRRKEETFSDWFIYFSSSQLSLYKHIRIEKEQHLELPQLVQEEEGKQIQIRTPEEREQPFYRSLFRSLPSFTIEDLFAQLYITYVNRFNFETWYCPLSELSTPVRRKGISQEQEEEGEEEKVTRTDKEQKVEEKEEKEEEEKEKETLPIVPAALTIPLNTKLVEEIVRIHDECGRGRYVSEYNQTISLLSQQIQDEIPQDWTEKRESFFFKLNTRSAKDSWYYRQSSLLDGIARFKKEKEGEREGGEREEGKRESLRKCEARGARDMLMAIIGSSRTSEDCRAWLQWKYQDPPEWTPKDDQITNKRENGKPPLVLVCQNWLDFPPELEFRCFCFDGKIRVVNQLCWSTYVPHLEQDPSLQQQIVKCAVEIYKLALPHLPWKHCIMDIIYNTELRAGQVCEFNPWGPYSCTGSQLFSYELDWDLIFGLGSQQHQLLSSQLAEREGGEVSKGEEEGDKKFGDGENLPPLRVLRPGMLVRTGFDLYLPKCYWKFEGGKGDCDDLGDNRKTISRDLYEKIMNSTQCCPCCSRARPVTKAPTKMVYYSSHRPHRDSKKENLKKI